MSEELKRLLEIASKPLKVPIKKIDYESSVYQFIAECKVKSSKTLYIPFSIIYMRYCKWCKNNNTKPKSIQPFASDFNKKFDKVSTARISQYYVSPEGFDITDVNLQDAEKYLQDVRRGKKKAKEKSKIRSTKGNT